METITSLLALMIVCAIVITPAVILGNYIYDRHQKKN